MTHYAIQDKNVGNIQYVTNAESEVQAVEKFDSEIGIGGIDVDEWEITELTEEQFLSLENCDGTDQDAIDLLESYK